MDYYRACHLKQDMALSSNRKPTSPVIDVETDKDLYEDEALTACPQKYI
jgi:hypothetical protein